MAKLTGNIGFCRCCCSPNNRKPVAINRKGRRVVLLPAAAYLTVMVFFSMKVSATYATSSYLITNTYKRSQTITTGSKLRIFESYMQAMPSIRYIHFFVLSLCYLGMTTSCQTQSNKSLTNDIEIDTTKFTSTDEPPSSKYMKVVNLMAQAQDVRWSESFTGEKSEQWSRYEWLSKNATNEQLLELMRSKFPNVRVYAFLSLKDRPKINLKPIILERLNDSSSFVWVNGCLGEEKRINSFCLEECSGLFSRKELNQYRNIISKGSDIYITIPQQ